MRTVNANANTNANSNTNTNTAANTKPAGAAGAMSRGRVPAVVRGALYLVRRTEALRGVAEPGLGYPEFWVPVAWSVGPVLEMGGSEQGCKVTVWIEGQVKVSAVVAWNKFTWGHRHFVLRRARARRTGPMGERLFELGGVAVRRLLYGGHYITD